MASGAFQSLDDIGEDVLPRLHMDGEDSQADAELYPDRPGSCGVELQKQEDLFPERSQFRLRDFSAEVVRELSSVNMLSSSRRLCRGPTFPRSVVAAKIFASASASDCRMLMTRAQASF